MNLCNSYSQLTRNFVCHLNTFSVILQISVDSTLLTIINIIKSPIDVRLIVIIIVIFFSKNITIIYVLQLNKFV